MKSQKKVYVGMSGGVDSSLSAALLVEAGYDVTGVYMKNWTADLPGLKCPWAEDLADAKRVAVQLGIPFKVFDFQDEYKHLVVDYMIREYSAGRTPNPDVMCNQEIKFKLFLDAALTDGAEMIATGHYARAKNGKLLRAACETKDQTYFLYRVTKESLEKTLFPLGDFVSKEDVRREATKRGLVTARKKDSQGICFVGSVGIRDFLSQFVETAPGDIIDENTGKVVGRHDGAIFYTFGQRHGLSVGGGLPYYIVGKDMAKNQIYVSTNLNVDGFWCNEITLTDVLWMTPPARPGLAKSEYKIRVRHRAPLINATIANLARTELIVKLMEPERAVAPGQSIVIYDGEVCLGGGIVR
ncbi:MAG: tRNA 2-thiouridine(34) synthase MnmA [Candidatus Nomurabacteria bacterium]|nr:tRNA 2-thiouridine(34) synthase MnmA [Candidatus Nomurabacteria bacterium]